METWHILPMMGLQLGLTLPDLVPTGNLAHLPHDGAPDRVNLASPCPLWRPGTLPMMGLQLGLTLPHLVGLSPLETWRILPMMGLQLGLRGVNPLPYLVPYGVLAHLAYDGGPVRINLASPCPLWRPGASCP